MSARDCTPCAVDAAAPRPFIPSNAKTTMTTMNYRRLGRSGLKVSELSFGSWVTYGNQMDEGRARECMAAAYDAGVNFFDNAEVYAKGESETIMGDGAEEARLAPLVLRRLDQVLLGDARRAEREEHAQPQIPDAGDRRLARPPRARLRRPRVLPSRRSGHADRGNGARDARHRERGQGHLLGHVRVERRRRSWRRGRSPTGITCTSR